MIAGGEVDGRADIYGLGCVAFWFLTGRRVFEGEGQMELLAKHLQARPGPPSRCVETPIPAALDELVLACLEKAPEDRPRNADALAAALAAIPFAAPWTPERAAAWWELHGHPDAAAGAGA
jgi:serine/threonine-protein kinase